MRLRPGWKQTYWRLRRVIEVCRLEWARAGGDMGGEAEREGRGRGRAEVRAYARSSAAREWREHRLEQTEIATMQDEQDRLCARVCEPCRARPQCIECADPAKSDIDMSCVYEYESVPSVSVPLQL